MKPTPAAGKRSARERLLEAADRLFYREGVRAVGIDRVLEEAGVAKGSLYYNFGGKDELVRTYLQNRHGKWAARIDERVGAAATPQEGILAIFDALGELFAEADFRGCAFINAVVEVGGTLPEAVDISRRHKLDMSAVIRTLLPAGSRTAKADARALAMAVDGAIIGAQFEDSPEVALKSLARVVKAITDTARM